MIHSTKPPHEQQVSALYNPSNLNPQGGYREINPAFSHKPSEAKITALPPGILEIQANSECWQHHFQNLKSLHGLFSCPYQTHFQRCSMAEGAIHSLMTIYGYLSENQTFVREFLKFFPFNTNYSLNAINSSSCKKPLFPV